MSKGGSFTTMNDSTVKLDTELIKRVKEYVKRNGNTLSGYLNKVVLWSIEYDEAEERVNDKKKRESRNNKPK